MVCDCRGETSYERRTTENLHNGQRRPHSRVHVLRGPCGMALVAAHILLYYSMYINPVCTLTTGIILYTVTIYVTLVM